jgi:precorrin-8X/cobalt-precorrin-8 methylmutase
VCRRRSTVRALEGETPKEIVVVSPTRVTHPIEIESYRIMRSRVDTSHLPPLTRAVVERVVHTSADPTWVGDLVADEQALHAGRAALLAGARLVTDVRMVASAVTALSGVVAIDLPDVAQTAAQHHITRSAAGIRLAAREFGAGAVWAIGNAPTALAELVRLAESGAVTPALVVGVPVGFVGAVAAKAALRESGLPAVSGVTERGGAAVAGAIVNALLYFDGDM